MKLIAALPAIALVAAAMSPAPSQAAAAPQQDQAVEGPSSAEVQYFQPDGKTLVSTQSYGASTEGQTLGPVTATPGNAGGGASPYSTGSGSGGTSLATGCAKVTVTNPYYNVLGGVAFKFKTWTNWSETRATENIYNVTTGWLISDVDGQEQWQGLVDNKTEQFFYDYGVDNGYPRSAYQNYLMGDFTNCVLKVGCWSEYYPANSIRSFYNGTWAWSTK